MLDDLAPGAVVLGHSFGGRVAVHLAPARPDRVGALVLTGVPLVRNPAGAGAGGPPLPSGSAGPSTAVAWSATSGWRR